MSHTSTPRTLAAFFDRLVDEEPEAVSGVMRLVFPSTMEDETIKSKLRAILRHVEPKAVDVAKDDLLAHVDQTAAKLRQLADLIEAGEADARDDERNLIAAWLRNRHPSESLDQLADDLLANDHRPSD